MGILVGYVCKWIKAGRWDRRSKSIMPVLIIPIVSALICCLAYLYILVGPLGALMKALTGMLSGNARRKCHTSGNCNRRHDSL